MFFNVCENDHQRNFVWECFKCDCEISYMLMMAFFLSYRCDICPRDDSSLLTGSPALYARALLARVSCWEQEKQ